MNITQDIVKWGNGQGVRLPKQVAEKVDLKPYETLAVTTRGRSIILTPIKKESAPKLEDLLAGTTPYNSDGEQNWGVPKGNELW